MDICGYFESPQNRHHKQYEAVRAFLYEKKPAEEVAKKFGFTKTTVYSLARDFKKRLKQDQLDQYLFANIHLGRNTKPNTQSLKDRIISLRKKYLSVEEIKQHMDSLDEKVSETYIYQEIKRSGFARLPRRTKLAKKDIQSSIKIEAPQSVKLGDKNEAFSSSNVGVLCFVPLIESYGIDKLILNSSYPETKTLPRINSILSFVALKLSNIKRYTKDDLWCMDRGLGLLAGLNVLPKAAWFSSYSHRVTREMNVAFLKSLHQLWLKNNLLSDTANLDFTTVPYWGDDSHLENNWSGKRHHALSSILAAISQDPDSGIITYGDADARQATESEVVIEFLDFYKTADDDSLKYLVFDSKFTTYQNLSKLDDNKVKFITIRRRGNKIIKELDALPKDSWKSVRVLAGDGKKRLLKVREQKIFLRDYGKEIRQIAITGNGKIKPALIITNDFDLHQADIIKKYAMRWIIEKTISEQTHFFHLNSVSSSMVIKVDFDLTMTILAYNIYRLLAMHLPRYSHQTAEKLYEQFIYNSGKVQIDNNRIIVSLKKKRHLPALISAMKPFAGFYISWLEKIFDVVAASNS
jgi:predicted DNA-binding transcriptional regulator AlpA